MKINSDDKLSYIQMLIRGTSSAEDIRITGRHDVQISIEASCNGFCGKNENIGFGEDEFQIFVDEMQTLENQRKGTAKLVSMGYPSEHAEFIMQVYPTDNTGHFAVKFVLQKMKYSAKHELSPLKVSGNFDLDSGDLHNIVAELQILFNSKGIIQG